MAVQEQWVNSEVPTEEILELGDSPLDWGETLYYGLTTRTLYVSDEGKWFKLELVST